MKSILSNLIITNVYSAFTIYTNSNVKIERKNREKWAVLIKYEGETIYFANGKKYISNAENMMVLPKGSNYTWECVKGGYYSIIEFDSDLCLNEIFSFPVKNTDKILNMFKAVEKKRIEKSPLYKMEIISDTYLILLELLKTSRSIYTPSSKRQKLLPAIEYISNHYTERISNDTLADRVGISTVYFRKLFTEVYGISPINYIISLRIKKAKEMLRSDYGSISDIALSLGYSNVYDFSRDFKKHTGLPPSKFES